MSKIYFIIKKGIGVSSLIKWPALIANKNFKRGKP